ncbi:toprim domain-containing protein [Enterobacter ludwigii]|uniref:toprim domain-containing protein n=1 Tax=Enterobacter ludwigii TaxID=299767 RepID=UPI003F71362F
MNKNIVSDTAKAAINRWPQLLPVLGIKVPANGKHGPCPKCEGVDRFRFDDIDGRGTWFCTHCGNGDGIDLVRKVSGTDLAGAARQVADALGTNPAQEHTTAPARKKASDGDKRARFDAGYQAMITASKSAESEYLQRKGVNGYLLPLTSAAVRAGGVLFPAGSAVLSLRDATGGITGAQLISPEGEKRLLPGSVLAGSYIEPEPLNDETPDVISITEGFATALAVKALGGGYVVAAVSANNLRNVAQLMRGRYPRARLIIAGDNDTREGEKNTGLESAEKAAKAVNGWVAVPPGENKTDWDDYRRSAGQDAACQEFSAGQYQPGKKPESAEKDKQAKPTLSQMGASQRGEVLLERYNGEMALDGLSDTVHYYDGAAWRPVSDRDLMREMASVFIAGSIPFSPNAIRSAVDALKLQIPMMGGTARNLIGFSNGVFDLHKGEFRAHRKEDWLLIASDVVFTAPAPGENLQQHAPHFWQWVSRAASGSESKIERIMSALFMVLANRYDWQLFLEVTGPGGSGKSIFAEICTMLAGKNNTVSANMAALENPRERAIVVGYSLIIMPDQTRYVGDGSGIKAITGGDEVSIDPKHKAPYSTRIPAVVLAVNNNAMAFSDRSGGVSRRRVIFHFGEAVPESERDPQLRSKIARELPVIIRHLLRRFTSQQEARQMLVEQQKSEEAIAIKRGTDSLVDFCGYLLASIEADGMLIGNAETIPFNPRKYLYHAYLAYMKGNNLAKPVSVTRFGLDMPGALAEFGKEYMRKKTKQGVRSNMNLDNDCAGEWLPEATGTGQPEE